MARQSFTYLAFNRGLVDPRGLARIDVKRLAISAEVYTNWTPSVLGAMALRAGLAYTGARRSNLPSRSLPFVYSNTDTAELEFTDLAMRVWIADTLLARPAVTAAVAGGTFPSGASLAANWTDADEAGATSAWVSAGKVGFTGTGTNAAIRRQQVTVNEVGAEHALRVVVERGPITIRVGSTSGGDEYVTEADLGTGTHSLAFTPTGASFYVQFQSRLERIVYLTSCDIEAAGTVEITSPYPTAALDYIRPDQSGDVVFLGCTGYQPRRVERRGTGRSWSIVLYDNQDGPFLVENVGPITITPSVLSGNGTFTASAALFKSTHVGALFSLTSTGQTVAKSMTAATDATNSIRVTGVGADRSITIILSGLSTTGNTVILQRSFDNSVWTAVSGKSWTADTTEAYADGLDNEIVYYRLYCSVYAGGTTSATLSIPTGSIRGIGRVTAFTNATTVDMEVLTAFGATNATDVWQEGQWSDKRGWPSAPALAEGRLWWAGGDKVNGTISDAFDSFDKTFEGDAGPIARSIGSGPVEIFNWILALQRIVLGGQGAEFSCRSSSLDEPLTPTNFNVKPASTQGSAPVQALRIDSHGVFVQRGGIRVYELAIGAETYDYTSSQLSGIVPRIGYPGIVRAAVQRQPDTRLHFVRSDGTVAMLVFDKLENVVCWCEIESTGADGLIEDVMVLPGATGTEEDKVYYTVARTVGGSTVRYREKFALEINCQGGTLNQQADSFVPFTNSPPSATVTGLTHLIGEQVVVWADGKCLDDGAGNPTLFTVNGAGEISLTDDGAAYQATQGIAGLYYSARWKAGKLLEPQAQGAAIGSYKNIKGMSMILGRTHPRGIKFGRSFAAADLNDMPSYEEGAPVNLNTMYSDYDAPPIPFPGGWATDSRLCIQAESPKPATVMALRADVEVN